MYRIGLWTIGVGILLTVSTPAVAADVSKIDRTIRKEPQYKGKPRYALLVFGPEAKMRVWVALDGDTLYVDRNGDRDLTGKDERFTVDFPNRNSNGYGNSRDCNIEIRDPDQKTRYLITSIGTYPQNDKPNAEREINANVEIKSSGSSYKQYCDAKLGNSPDKASVAHYGGPLMIEPRRIWWKLTPELSRLPSGDPPGEIQAVVGTMDAERGCWVVVRSEELPKDLHPVVEVEFHSCTTGEPIKERYQLKERC
jgi:hypothetical protein